MENKYNTFADLKATIFMQTSTTKMLVRMEAVLVRYPLPLQVNSYYFILC